ncbi:MAG: hypothetical protein MUO91_04420 [candidate division Zixibacteria bacterium]|nr:hypothetical protein [candidate division Zixibacteria bacterium]
MMKYKAITILVLSLFVLVCSKTKNPVINPPSFQFESSQSDCKGSFRENTGGTINSGGVIIFSSHGDTIWVIHQDASYNCCSKIKVNVKATPNGFDLLEYDVGDTCKCMCYFDITTTISDVSPGTYLIRVFDTDTNLVGSVVVDIPSKYTGFESSQSQCKGGLYKKDAKANPDAFEDSVLAWAQADTVWVTHKNALYNCCSKIKVRITPTLQGFDLYEYDEAGELCTCDCYFDITTIIFGVSPGTYLIRVFDTDTNLVGSGVVDIPAKYTGSESSQSGCKKGLGKINAQTIPTDTPKDSIIVWSHGDTAWVTHKNVFYNCCSIIKTKLERTPEGFNLYEYDIATSWCYCGCYFDLTTTIYGLSPGVYLIRVFDTVGEFVGEVELVIPPK